MNENTCGHQWCEAIPGRAQAHARKRRARKLQVISAPWTHADITMLWGDACYLCGDDLQEDWHAEHVIPISRGGWDCLGNLRPACPTCNVRKGAKLPPAPVQATVWTDLFYWYISRRPT